jgi:hypothetical protein
MPGAALKRRLGLFGDLTSRSHTYAGGPKQSSCAERVSVCVRKPCACTLSGDRCSMPFSFATTYEPDVCGLTA